MLRKLIQPALLVLVLAIPLTLTGQDAATAGGDVAGQGTIDAATESAQAHIDAALQTAFEAGIPVSLLESKIAEGHAKGIPVERIAAAVQGRLQALMHAAETLRAAQVDVQSAGELSIAVEALEAGVEEDALVRVSRSASPERRIVAVSVLTGLVRLGNASQNALARVNAALGANTALANLSAEVASQLRAEGLGATLDVPGQVGAGAAANAAGGIGIGSSAGANGDAASGVEIGNGPGASAGAEVGAGVGGEATIPSPPAPQLPDVPQQPAGGLDGGLEVHGTLGGGLPGVD